MNLRRDTLAQLIQLSAIRPGGRYLLVDDTGGLVLSAVLERMGGKGRVMVITDNESPPAWPVIEMMNFPPAMIANMVSYLNWAQVEEDYKPVEMKLAVEEPEEVAAPKEVSEEQAAKAARSRMKEMAKIKKRDAVLEELTATREELHRGNWDG
jgi:tRNA (adenine-N(1)-)-methyltransferase non-catalytic subunit